MTSFSKPGDKKFLLAMVLIKDGESVSEQVGLGAHMSAHTHKKVQWLDMNCSAIHREELKQAGVGWDNSAHKAIAGR